jgi:hypothetical protein
MSKAVVLPLRVHKDVYTLTRDSALTDAQSLAIPDVLAGARFAAFAGKDGYPKLDIIKLGENLKRISKGLNRSASRAACARARERADPDVQWCPAVAVEEATALWATYRRAEEVATFPAIADPVKFERLLTGDWQLDDWTHLSLADFMPAEAAKGAARYPSDAAGAPTRGYSQLAMLATQLEGFARVYTVLFGSTFEHLTATFVSDIRNRSPTYTDVGMDYLYARLHEQMAGAHWDLAHQAVSKEFGTPIGSPSDAVRLIQRYITDIDLRPDMEPLFMRLDFPLISRGSRSASGHAASKGAAAKRPRSELAPLQQQRKKAKSVSFSPTASDSDSAPAPARRPPSGTTTQQGSRPAHPGPPAARGTPAQPPRPVSATSVRTVDGVCLFEAARAAGCVDRQGAQIRCRSPAGLPCKNGAHTALVGPRAASFGRSFASALASGQQMPFPPEQCTLIARHCAPNAR